ncbi:hypothetical protein M2T82_05700 [Elizabethkingia ursingii]|uniref:hypothetical protein n=1 Tax=Elizabethkingia ursingii TaxID=1756150 RepID=UPI002012FEC3|nr:hypothetical protein [Elizabethkingia ursingii]MCL1667552.1 hypothetical protein [Elizabethkingia ursingii]
MIKTAQILSFLVLLGMFSSTHAQIKSNLSSGGNTETKEERMNDYHQARVDILVKNLGLNDNQEKAFREVYNNYEVSQMFVMKEFKEKYNKPELSEEETKEKIYTGFDVSQKLLNNKRTYADRFLKVLTPKQLEKMFEMEKRMGRRIMDKKHQEEVKK